MPPLTTACALCGLPLAEGMRFCPRDGHPRQSTGGVLLEGRFRLLELVGQGATGDVYRAHQLGIERTVAVKLLNEAACASDEFVARFIREAQTLARLSHPHILSVFHIGGAVEHASEASHAQRPFMVTEWVGGRPLGDEALSLRERLQLALQISSALAHSHANGVVHRDLKPDNILVVRDDQGLRCKLLDFGLAKLSLGDDDSALTRAGVIYGTPNYLSPEQAAGLPVDERSDVYSLGVVLYELFSGELPFRGEGLEVLVEHAHSQPPALSSKAPTLPVALCALVMDLLAKKPEARPRIAEVHARLLGVAAELSRERPRLAANALRAVSTEDVVVRDDLASALPTPESRPRVAGRRASKALALGLAAAAAFVLWSKRDALSTTRAAPPSRSLAVEASPAVDVPIGPQRALVLSSSGYALRVLVGEELQAQRPERLRFELWDPSGRPLDQDALIVVLQTPEGQRQGLVVPRVAPGRFELWQDFAAAGAYVLEVVPEESDVEMTLHVEVEGARPPQS